MIDFQSPHTLNRIKKIKLLYNSGKLRVQRSMNDTILKENFIYLLDLIDIGLSNCLTYAITYRNCNSTVKLNNKHEKLHIFLQLIYRYCCCS